MDIHVFYDDRELNRLSQVFKDSPEIFGQALRAALRRTGGNMRKNVRKGMKAASYLKSADIASAIGRLQLNGMEAALTVAGAMKAGHKFRMVPNRVTARKGKRSIYWPSPGVNIGPGEPLRYPRKAGYYKPFIAKTRSGLKAMYWREKGTNQLSMPTVAAPQYFAAFDRVKDPVLAEAETAFMRRLEHEIDYRLGLK